MHWGINLPSLPQKHHPDPFCQAPLNLQTVQAPFFKQLPLPYILVFRDPPLKIGIFSDSILNPSHLLKVIKLLVKISQFKFLRVTKKNIFVYKPFCC